MAMSCRRITGSLQWEYLNEGGANMVLRYTGESTEFRGCVLRLRKGVKNDEAKRQIEEDSQFQRLVLQPILDGYIKPGTLVELDEDLAAFLHSEVIQCARPPDRKQAEETGYPAPMDLAAVPAMLCTDLGFCPNGFSFEIKPKLGIADCGVPECGIADVPRFAMLQCIDFPKKKKSLSKYNPVRFFQAVLYQQKKQLREELEFLRDASRDARQNNFRLLGHQNEVHLVPDAALDDLCEVLLHATALFSKLRAMDLLAAGRAVEDLVQQLYEVAGSPSELPARCFEEALGAGGKELLEELRKTSSDREAMTLVLDAYKTLRPDLVLALFLLGRAMHDMSLIVNLRRPMRGDDFEAYANLGYVRVGEVDLWARLTVIDTDIKPADRIPKYAKTLREYIQHHHVQTLLSYMGTGKTLYEGLEEVKKRFQAG